MIRRIQFSPPDITEGEISEVIEALKSGWITTGPKTKELERLVAKRCNTNRAVCLNSNTACAELTLRLLGIGEGDEVIVPAYTYTATASVVAHVGATIVMIDCEKDKFTMDYDKLENAISENTKAIIPVDLFGIPCDYDRIFEIVERKKRAFRASVNKIQMALNRVAVISDAAHSFGAIYKGDPIGSVADFTNFSFHAVKNLTTAEGGAVTWKDIKGINNEDIYREYQLMSLHGQSKDAFLKNIPGAWEYDIVQPWYKCNMTDVHAAIGIGQIKRYDETLKRRKSIIQRMNQAFKGLSVKTVEHYGKDHISSGHLYITRLFDKNGNPIDEPCRNMIIIKMAELGIATNVHYKPLPMHSGYKMLGFNISDFPNAYEQYKNEITLPLHNCLSDDDIEYIIGSFIKVQSFVNN